MRTRPLGRAVWRRATFLTLRCLTFELSGRRRQDARPRLAKMYCVPPDRAWWPAVGAPLERGVRQRAAVVEVQAKCSRSKFGALTRQSRWWHEEMASRADGWPALTRARTGVWTRLRPGRVAAEGTKTRQQGTRNTQQQMSKDEAAWPSRSEGRHHFDLALPNVRAKRAATAGRQARAGENVPRTARLGLVACRWRSA